MVFHYIYLSEIILYAWLIDLINIFFLFWSHNRNDDKKGKYSETKQKKQKREHWIEYFKEKSFFWIFRFDLIWFSREICDLFALICLMFLMLFELWALGYNMWTKIILWNTGRDSYKNTRTVPSAQINIFYRNLFRLTLRSTSDLAWQKFKENPNQESPKKFIPSNQSDATKKILVMDLHYLKISLPYIKSCC